MINLECFWGGKRIDPRLRKQKRKKPGGLTDGRCGPSVSIVLHLSVEGLSARKICVVSQLATKYKALVIFLEEAHGAKANRLVIPLFSLSGLVSSKKHGLATLVYEKLCWALTDLSPEGSAIEWLCVDVDDCKIVSVYKPPTYRLIPTAIPVFQHPCLYAVDFNCQHTDWGYILPVQMENAWLTGQPKAISLSYTIRRIPITFSLVVGMLKLIQILLSRVLTKTACSWIDVLYRRFSRLQHRPLLIMAAKNLVPVSSVPYKRWKFREAN